MRPRGLPVLLAVLLPLAAQAAPDGAPAGIGVAGYVLERPPLCLGTNVEDLSGLAFDRQTGTIFGVLNGKTSLIEFEPGGRVLRHIPLNGFEDTEDVVWIAARRFAVVEERRRNLVFFELPAGGAGAGVDYRRTTRWLVDPVPAGNSGLEGLTFDAQHNRFLIAKEKKPIRFYQVRPPAQPGQAPAITTPPPAETNTFGMTDVSALYLDDVTGRLLVLSQESRCLVEVAPDGREAGRLWLTAGSAGLKADIPQAEGVTMDGRRTLYIASEPNLVYVFRPAAARTP